MDVRIADEREIDQITRMWYESWQDGHARVLPAELIRIRTLDNFRDRLRAGFAGLRVVGPIGAVVGLSIVQDDELYQLFVAASARGSGAAVALLADAEARLAAAGVDTAWLACAIGNDRAARFYEKHGWHRAGTMVSQLETPDGLFPLEVWRYEKRLANGSRSGSARS